MVTFDRRWLPLNALRAFDAVGRHLSFTAAAAALNVSQSAVSRHVIGLEALLGLALFERRPHSLVLTKAGVALLPIVRGSFDRIEQALNDVVRDGGGMRTLRLQLPPSFAQKLALPILQGFRREFPDIFVDLSSQGMTGAPRAETDAAVIYDRQRTGVAVSDLLWMCRVTPACSPRLAAMHDGKSLAQFVAESELLHVKLEGEAPGLIWEAFSRHFGLGVQTGRGLAFDTATLAAQYAIGGEGVALLDVELFARDIADGVLVTPFSETFEDGYGYFLSLAAEDLADPVISVFRAWMIGNFAGGEGRKAFFSEEKKQKTFLSAVARFRDNHPTGTKSFLVLFQKRSLAFFMHASLPMYDLPELQAANDTLWAAIAARLQRQGIAAPPALWRGSWISESLLLGQTCGYPLMTSLAGKVVVVATPVYLAEGCDRAMYRSAIVVRAADPAASLADLHGRRCAVNDLESNSGMNVLRAAVAPMANGAGRFFGEVVTTGSHVASVAAVAARRADVAAIDCVTWAHLRRWRPAVRDLRVLDWTQATPGLPLVTAITTPEATRLALAGALDEVAADPALADVRAVCCWAGLRRLGMTRSWRLSGRRWGGVCGFAVRTREKGLLF